MSKYKSLAKNIFLFALSSFIPKFISYILISIYTACLTTTEFGISDIINTTVSLFLPIFTLNIRDAVLRFSLDKKYKPEDSLNISLRIVLVDIVLLIIFTVIISLFDILNIKPLYLLYFDVLLVANALYDVFNAFCKSTDKVKTIVYASITNSILTFTFNILLIVFLKKGLNGFLLANSLGIITAILVFFIHAKLYKNISKSYSKMQLKEMIKYSFPMVFSAIAWWVNNASDRYIITFIIGVSASGVYAVASKIPSIITTFQNVFLQAWSISAIKEFDKDDKDGFIGNIYTLMSCLLCMLCSLIIVLNIPLSKIMFSGDFFVAWKYVPPLVLSVTIDGLALFIGNLFFAVKDTKARAWATIVGAIVNTILNFVLIKIIGVYGAAIATVVGYFIGFVYSRIKIKKYIKMNTDMHLNDFILTLLTIQVVLAYFGNNFILFQIIILMLIGLLYRNYIWKVFTTIRKKIIKK